MPFNYPLRMLYFNPELFSSLNMNIQPLNEFHLGMPCDCIPNSSTFLLSLTKSLNNNGIIDIFQYHWINQNIKKGEIQQYSIILSGNISIGYGDFSMGSNNRCGYGSIIEVPNPCSNKCLFGEWNKNKHWKPVHGAKCDKTICI